jgi:hypothetical protein
MVSRSMVADVVVVISHTPRYIMQWTGKAACCRWMFDDGRIWKQPGGKDGQVFALFAFIT